MSTKRIIVITSESNYAVGNLFVKALKNLGHEVERFDLFKVLSRYEKGGWLGQKVNTFWPVEAWTRKANRELAVFIQRFRPDHILISGDNPVQIGALAFARSILPNLKVTLFWPDTLVNLSFSITQLSPVVDTLASYSSTAIDQFKLMGFRHCIWMPFAGDVAFLMDESDKINPGLYTYDCSFVGGWRPERELALEKISTAMSDISLRIIGPLWSKNVRNKQLVKYIDDTPRYGKEFGAFIRSSRINLNIIDDTNYPAANMRFFEIPAAGGLQLSSSCPEMESVFIEGEHIFYYHHPDAIVDKIRYILSNPGIADRVRLQGHQYVRDQHTYMDRMKSIV
ncbi:MAG: glycosyltransferase [Saprospiraceae bacterium]|nr:glycosyltransferase [Candidatus Opimibacter iunctus]